MGLQRIRYGWETNTHTHTHISSVQSLSCVPMWKLTLTTPCSATCQAPVHYQLPELTQTHVHGVVKPSNHVILCHLLLLLPQSFQWIFRTDSFRKDWLDLLAVQGLLKSLLQHHSPKASIFQHWAFFTVQLSHPCMTTGKIIALTRWTLVDKVMFLLFNILSRLVIVFLPRSKCLLILWL